jgi:hypothetical protein
MIRPIILAALLTLGAQAAETGITDLAPIDLRSGVNRIPALAPDGRDGLVVLGWRDNGNAHGYDIALVLLQKGARSGWNVVRVEPTPDDQTSTGADVITDSPHAGDDMAKAFRLSRGKMDGRPATLLLVATRDQGAAPIPNPSRVTF